MEAPIGRHARAKFSYKALYEADLTIRKGEVVEIVEVVVSGCVVLAISARAPSLLMYRPLIYYGQAIVEGPTHSRWYYG